jgi:hypothetical protein
MSDKNEKHDTKISVSITAGPATNATGINISEKKIIF